MRPSPPVPVLCVWLPSHLLCKPPLSTPVQEFEELNNFQYDVIILYRPDVILFNDVPLSRYMLSDSLIYSNDGSSCCQGDFHFVMTSASARAFQSAFDYSRKLFPLHHGFFVPFITEGLGKAWTSDWTLACRDQEVLRKIHKLNCVANDTASRKILLDKYNYSW